MFESDNEENIRKWLRQVCAPVEAPAAFKENLKQEISHNLVRASSYPEAVLGLSPATWALITALIAIALIAYGLTSVPSPSVVINSAPQNLPQSIILLPPV